MSGGDGESICSSDGIGTDILAKILVAPSKSSRHVSVLFFTPQWRLDSYGTSSITRSLIKNLRAVDPERKFIKIAYTVLEEQGNIQSKEADDLNVHLKGFIFPRGTKREPDVQLLDEDVLKYYYHDIRGMKYDFIIGYVPYLVYGCLNLRDSFRDTGHATKVILFAHELPQLESGETDETQLREWLSEADVVFSMEKSTRDEIMKQMDMLQAEEDSLHKSYVPGFPIEHFEVQQEDRRECKSESEIMMITPTKKDDFSLGMNSVAGACDESVQVTLTMLSENSDQEEFVSEFRSLKIENLNFVHHTMKDRDELKSYMKSSSSSSFW